MFIRLTEQTKVLLAMNAMKGRPVQYPPAETENRINFLIPGNITGRREVTGGRKWAEFILLGCHSRVKLTDNNRKRSDRHGGPLPSSSAINDGVDLFRILYLKMMRNKDKHIKEILVYILYKLIRGCKLDEIDKSLG